MTRIARPATRKSLKYRGQRASCRRDSAGKWAFRSSAVYRFAGSGIPAPHVVYKLLLTNFSIGETSSLDLNWNLRHPIFVEAGGLGASMENRKLTLELKLRGDTDSRLIGAARMRVDGRGGLLLYESPGAAPMEIRLAELQSFSIRPASQIHRATAA